MSRGPTHAPTRTDLVRVPSPSLGPDLAQLLASGEGADCEFAVEDEVRWGRGHGWKFTWQQCLKGALGGFQVSGRRRSEGEKDCPQLCVPAAA